MIIDCHGHYTTAPSELERWRSAQLRAWQDAAPLPDPDAVRLDDDTLRASVEGSQLRLQRERGIDLTLFSPRASAMAHHLGDGATAQGWARLCNDTVGRVCALYPDRFVPVAQLPQARGVDPAACIPEIERCVREHGIVGVNLNPDPSGGHWTSPPLTDRAWYPLYEALVTLRLPAMVHVSASCNACFHATGAHYLNADTTAFMQFLTSDLFRDFPELQFVIPHGGGAVPYHWGRYRGLALDMKRPPLDELLLGNVCFDTCVYHQPGIDLLCKVIPARNVLFASEMVGAVRGIDPETGFHFDDTRRYIDACAELDAEERAAIYAGNALRVYPRLAERLARFGTVLRTLQISRD